MGKSIKSETLKPLKDYKKQLFLGPLFKSLEVIFELLIPFIVKFIIEDGLQNNDSFYVITRCFLILSFGILGFISTCVCQYYASVASIGFGCKLRENIYLHSNDLSLKQFNNFSKGYIQTLITNDSFNLQNAVALTIRLIIRAPFLVIGSLICSFLINIYVGIIFLTIVIIISLILLLIIKFSSKKYLKIQEQLDLISNNVSDTIKGSRVIRSFNNENEQIIKFKNETKIYKKKVINVETINSLINPLTFAIINIGIILILYFTTNNNFSLFNLTSGDLVALINYLNQILIAILVVSNLVVVFNKANASKERIDNFFDTENEIISGNLTTINNSNKILEFENVYFSFNQGKKYVINDLSFTLNSEESLGILGPTGSGKTSIFNLILKLYNSDKGKILFFNEDINKYDINFLRNNISYVSQNSLLFKGTIKSNMLLAKNNASDDEIIKALKLANAYEFVFKYKDNINHEVKENGINFSGGQKQRLTLARAFLKDCKLLLIDDSFSALDNASESIIKNNIKKLQKEKKFSLIVISQRISSIKDLNNIIVLENGKIENYGNNEELLTNSSLYKQIYSIQIEDL